MGTDLLLRLLFREAVGPSPCFATDRRSTFSHPPIGHGALVCCQAWFLAGLRPCPHIRFSNDDALFQNRRYERMLTQQDLLKTLKRIDRKSYGAYKELRGEYRFEGNIDLMGIFYILIMFKVTRLLRLQG
ncbi:ABC-ATPase domain-containing protein [Petroclostridium sp. X23]|uniref:ABC-ATPase domain-containing protein n=1 Tax=Petroclostridium sp. X23 TaxID=3045146 RepID=UPI0024ACC279|nr:ABC-ATPase domain-containing protein [Petroclostridium sp. X23]WHH59620.1 hypothetical protein QKW49_02335 [Petroclostridium sp. X23]